MTRIPRSAAVILLLLLACNSNDDRRLQVDRESLTLRVGESVFVQWSVLSGKEWSITAPSTKHYDNLSHPERFTWRSSDPLVATVDPRGAVRGVAPGQAVVHAEAEGLQAPPLPVTVEAAP